jgi:hypothetical protein
MYHLRRRFGVMARTKGKGLSPQLPRRAQIPACCHTAFVLKLCPGLAVTLTAFLKLAWHPVIVPRPTGVVLQRERLTPPFARPRARLSRSHPSSPADQKIPTRNNAAAAATTTLP